MPYHNIEDEDWFLYGGLLEEAEEEQRIGHRPNRYEAACGLFLLGAMVLIVFALLLSITWGK